MTRRLLCRAPRALWRRAGTDVLATTPEAAEVWCLAGGAAAVWLGLNEPSTAEELVELLADVYQVAPENIDPDVTSTLERLSEMSLVVPSEAEP